MKTFGKMIASTRIKKKLNQKELASKITKPDGNSISPQYLNDIEHDRRKPTGDELLKQFSEVLDISFDYLLYLSGVFPKDIKDLNLSEEKVDHLYKTFRSENTEGMNEMD